MSVMAMFQQLRRHHLLRSVTIWLRLFEWKT
jgi:hypothetical protein